MTNSNIPNTPPPPAHTAGQTIHVVYVDPDGDVVAKSFPVFAEVGNEVLVHGADSDLGRVEISRDGLEGQVVTTRIDCDEIVADSAPADAFATFKARVECEISECEYRIQELRRRIKQAEELRQQTEVRT